MGHRIGAEPKLELLAPISLNIACFRYREAPEKELDRINALIVVELQEQDIGARLAIRSCLCSYCTEQRDLDALVDGVLQLGRDQRRASR